MTRSWALRPKTVRTLAANGSKSDRDLLHVKAIDRLKGRKEFLEEKARTLTSRWSSVEPRRAQVPVDVRADWRSILAHCEEIEGIDA